MNRQDRIFILNEPTALRISPALAEEIGLNESIILLQIEFWISISDHLIDGRRWTYQSIRDMKEKAFPFWSKDTINRTIASLIKKNLLIEGNFNSKKYDRTRWFALGDGIRNLQSIRFVEGYETRSTQNETHLTQNETRLKQNETQKKQNETTIPEITTEITTKNTTEEYILSPAPFSEDDINQLNEKEKDKDANRIEKVPYQKIVDAYNDICVSMPSVKAVTTKRKEKMKILYREVQDLDVIEECFRKAEKSSFLNGSSGKWSGCNFDWLVNYNNFVKVLEGTYDDKEVVKKRKEIDYEAAARNSKYGF